MQAKLQHDSDPTTRGNTPRADVTPGLTPGGPIPCGSNCGDTASPPTPLQRVPRKQRQAKAARIALKHAEESAKRPVASKHTHELGKKAAATRGSRDKGPAAKKPSVSKLAAELAAAAAPALKLLAGKTHLNGHSSKKCQNRSPRAGKNVRRRAARFVKLMDPVLEPRENEVHPCETWLILNRLGLWSGKPKARNDGYAADIYPAILRISDRLRIHYRENVPKSLGYIVEGDPFDLQDLEKMYEGDSAFHRVNIDALAAQLPSLSSPSDIQSALTSCIIENFDFGGYWEESGVFEVRNVDEGVVKQAVKQAFINKKLWLSSPPHERENFARRAGLARISEKRKSLMKEDGISMLRQTCVKGGNHA